MRIPITLAFAALLTACGGGGGASTPVADQPTSPPAATSEPAPMATLTPRPTEVVEPTPEPIEVTGVTYAAALDENQGPIDPTESFLPTDTVNLSVAIAGRPRSGIVGAQFFWRDTLIAETEVDIATVNSDVVLSIGETTQVGFNFTPNAPLYVSGLYRTRITVNGEEIGEYPFSIVAPEGAIESRVTSVVLARGTTENFDPIEPATTYAPDDAIFIVGAGDIGASSYIDIAWYINGELLADGSSPLTSAEDAPNVGFFFCLRPANGWDAGDHEVRITLDDNVIETLPFSIDPNQAAIESTPECETPDTSVDFDSPQTFTWPNGLFQIDIPATWVAGEQGIENGTLTARWNDANEQVQIVALLYTDTSGGDTAAIINDAATLVRDTFGDRAGFEADEPVEQSDGSTLLSWSYFDSETGDARLLRGTLYVELRETVVSYLFVTVPDDRAEELWDAGLGTLVNSYRIDPSQPVE